MSRSAGRIPFRPEPWIDAVVLPDGRLRLSSTRGDKVYHAEPAAAAMWIALCQNDWSVDAAACALAAVWQADEVNLRADLDILIGELFDFGLLAQRA